MSFRSLVYGLFLLLATASASVPGNASALAMDVIPFGHGTAEVKRVFSLLLHGAEHRSYLVEFEGREVVVMTNPQFKLPDANVGDQLEFRILWIGAPSGQKFLHFVRTDIARDKAEWERVSRPVSSPTKREPENEIFISKDDSIRVNGVAMDANALKTWLADPDVKSQRIVLRSHPESTYDATVRLLDLLGVAGIKNVSFTADGDGL